MSRVAPLTFLPMAGRPRTPSDSTSSLSGLARSRKRRSKHRGSATFTQRHERQQLVRDVGFTPPVLIEPNESGARVVLRDDPLEPELASYLRIEERELVTYIVWLTRLRMLPSGSLNHTALKSSAICTSPSRVVSGRS